MQEFVKPKECLRLQNTPLSSPGPSPPTTRLPALLLHCVQMKSCSYTTKVAREKRDAREYWLSCPRHYSGDLTQPSRFVPSHLTLGPCYTKGCIATCKFRAKDRKCLTQAIKHMINRVPSCGYV